MARIIKAKQPIFTTSGSIDRAVLERVEATLSTAMEELRLAWGVRPEPATANDERPDKLPRGTADVADQAAEAVALVLVPPPPTLRQRIETVLRGASLELAPLARALGEPSGRVAPEIRSLIKVGLISNVGLAEHPIWTWKIGDNTSAAELNAAVLRLISERPMGTRDLVAATGARYTRVGGAVVAIQRSGVRIVDLGMGRAGMWFVMSDIARDARLEPKK